MFWLAVFIFEELLKSLKIHFWRKKRGKLQKFLKLHVHKKGKFILGL